MKFCSLGPTNEKKKIHTISQMNITSPKEVMPLQMLVCLSVSWELYAKSQEPNLMKFSGEARDVTRIN